MNSRTNCNSNGDCDIGVFERPRFFSHQLVGPTELNLAQDYFRKRMRTHNRMLHGWGVVCGALVERVSTKGKSPEGCYTTSQQRQSSEQENWKVKITKGYLLGPYGNEIAIDRDYTFDIRQAFNGITPGNEPWQSTPCQNLSSGVCYYLAIRYEEIESSPVQVQPPGCGCEQTDCEYTRWTDAFQVKLFPDLPPGYECCEEIPSAKSAGTEKRMQSSQVQIAERAKRTHDKCDFIYGDCEWLTQCPCPDGPWIVLAIICVDDCGITEEIDNWSCRRLVKTHAHECWTCVPLETTPSEDSGGKNFPGSEDKNHYGDEREDYPIHEKEKDRNKEADEQLKNVELTQIRGITKPYITALNAEGIHNAFVLVEKLGRLESRKAFVKKYEGITEKTLARFVSQADVVRPLLLLKDVDQDSANYSAKLLVAKDIKTVDALAALGARDPDTLIKELKWTPAEGAIDAAKLVEAFPIAKDLGNRVIH